MIPEQFFDAQNVCTPFELIRNGRVAVSADGQITSVKSRVDQAANTVENLIIPGLIDIHVHGGFGVNFGDGSLAVELEKYSRFAASRGVTGFLLSITGPNADLITQQIKTYVDILENTSIWPGAVPLGLHLEGPFLNREKHGAFNPDWIHNPNKAEVAAYLQAGNGWIKQVSMAPELPEAEATAQMLVDAGVVVSLGHSNTTYEKASAALENNFSHITHTFNAQSPFNHREPGVVGAVLSSDSATAELIGDSIHVHPAAMKILFRCLGPERIVLITDAMSGAGLPDGVYELLNQKVTVINGKATLPDGTIGGSTGTLDGCLRNLVNHVGLSIPDAVRTASFNPAKVISEEKRLGSIAVGKDANLVLLDEALNVKQTIVKGKCVFAGNGGK